MRCLVGIDDTDSSRGYCTTYLAYRIALDLRPRVKVLPYPRLVRLNPNIPFKTRGNASVGLLLEAEDPDMAFELVCSKVRELSDVEGGANSGVAFLEEPSRGDALRPLYEDALCGVVNPHRARSMLKAAGARTYELGNGMGVVGAACALAFDGTPDRTFELIAYRNERFWGTPRQIDSASVKEMDAATFPETCNNYDYEKRRVLLAPHGPDPVFAGVRGESPSSVLAAFRMLRYTEELDGHMVYVSNQHTDAHLSRPLNPKAYSSGWLQGEAGRAEVGQGGHVYFELKAGGESHLVAAYEPTGDLRRAARLLVAGDLVRAFGGVRRASSRHRTVLNLERLDVLKSSRLPAGTYLASPRSNRHLTKPLARHGREDGSEPARMDGWLSGEAAGALASVRTSNL